MASVVNSFAIEGINAYIVKIETDTIFGQPSVSIVGLGDAAEASLTSSSQRPSRVSRIKKKKNNTLTMNLYN